MNDDQPTADLCARISVFRAIRAGDLVVIDDGIPIILIPNLDPEQVHICTGAQVSVNPREQETVVGLTADRTNAFILCLGPGDHQLDVSVRV